jgi:hypothetical protein
MTRTHTDEITIGRNPGLTYSILSSLAEKRAREIESARRKERYCRFAKNCIDTLRFWK